MTLLNTAMYVFSVEYYKPSASATEKPRWHFKHTYAVHDTIINSYNTIYSW